MIYFQKSKTGRKAHAPLWWAKLMLHYPQIHLPLLDQLYEKTSWFKQFIKNLPQKCPFERQIWYNDTLLLFVPALCPFNPLFSQLINLKLRYMNETYE